jgi:hypothetical protein
MSDTLTEEEAGQELREARLVWLPWRLLLALLVLIAIPMLCAATKDVAQQFEYTDAVGYAGAGYFLAIVLSLTIPVAGGIGYLIIRLLPKLAGAI